MKTGEIEVIIDDNVELLSKSKTPPFEIDEFVHNVKEEVRLKYRYLDLRRPKLQNYLKFRAKMNNFTREWFSSRDFLEVQTPILANSSPE
jgi:aspartyl-tRNA synthetase